MTSRTKRDYLMRRARRRLSIIKPLWKEIWNIYVSPGSMGTDMPTQTQEHTTYSNDNDMIRSVLSDTTYKCPIWESGIRHDTTSPIEVTRPNRCHHIKRLQQISRSIFKHEIANKILTIAECNKLFIQLRFCNLWLITCEIKQMPVANKTKSSSPTITSKA